MEISVKLVSIIVPMLLAIALSISAILGWFVNNKENWNKSNEIMETQQVDINKPILGKSYPIIEGTNLRVKLGIDFDVKERIRAYDYQDGDLSNYINTYGNVDTNRKGVYTIRIVVQNSLGLKTVKHIQVIVD